MRTTHLVPRAALSLAVFLSSVSASPVPAHQPALEWDFIARYVDADSVPELARRAPVEVDLESVSTVPATTNTLTSLVVYNGASSTSAAVSTSTSTADKTSAIILNPEPSASSSSAAASSSPSSSATIIGASAPSGSIATSGATRLSSVSAVLGSAVLVSTLIATYLV